MSSTNDSQSPLLCAVKLKSSKSSCMIVPVGLCKYVFVSMFRYTTLLYTYTLISKVESHCLLFACFIGVNRQSIHVQNEIDSLLKIQYRFIQKSK